MKDKNLDKVKESTSQDCPHCKRCPTRGRRDDYTPWYPYRYVPWETTPWIYPWTDADTGTSVTTANSDTWLIAHGNKT